jgi:RsiW-degrading membrane proteinase PrsW (M82 family)
MDLAGRVASLARYTVPFLGGTALMGTVNTVVLVALLLAVPSATLAETLACDIGRVAAVQEPVTSKLLPAVGVWLWADSEGRLPVLRDGRLRYAVLGGLTVGLTEAVLKNVSPLFPLASAGPETRLLTLLPVALHVLTGTVVGLAVYGAVDRGVRAAAPRVLVALAVAVGAHFLWNTRVAFLLAGSNPC